MAASISPARAAAFDVVRRVFEDEAYADRALRGAVAGLDDRDRALARQLAYGTVQRARTLDLAIEKIGRRPVRRLDAAVRAALRLGGVPARLPRGVPRYAAVNESVELVRRARLERAVPFTNAVLRRLADEGRALVEALPDATSEEAALAHSYPDWVAETWWRDLGADGARALMRARTRHRRPSSGSFGARSTASPTRTSRARGTSSAWTSARIAEGRVWPQSAGSQLAGLAVGSVEGERVLDLCAAPGGKATMLAGEVVAVELNEARARELEENVAPARRRERARRLRGRP